MKFCNDFTLEEKEYFDKASDIFNNYNLDINNLKLCSDSSKSVCIRKIKNSFFITYVFDNNLDYSNNRVLFHRSIKDAVMGLLNYYPNDKFRENIINELGDVYFSKVEVKNLEDVKLNQREIEYLKGVRNIYNSFGILNNSYSFLGYADNKNCFQKLGNKFYMTFYAENGNYNNVRFYNDIEKAIKDFTKYLCYDYQYGKINYKIINLKR